MATYTVRSGDTLSRIAKHFGVSVAELLRLNPQIHDVNLIHRGASLTVPEFEDSTPAISPVVPVNGATPWFGMAMQEMAIGIDEIPGPEDNPRIVGYHRSTTLAAADDETPWCSSFVNWCMEQAALQGTKSASARSWLRWGQELSMPRRGCVVVLSRGNNPQEGHVGFYFDDAGDRILVLGGNQSNRVNVSSYPKARVLSYRWPS
jgi:uncharacterized protein (TIGR02594 family)